MTPITKTLTSRIYQAAFDGHSLANECDRGVVMHTASGGCRRRPLFGFLNGYERNTEHSEYRDAALAEWEFIKTYVVDKRNGSEWFWEVNEDGSPILDRPIVEPWKCPYHNGRMCIESHPQNRSIKQIHLFLEKEWRFDECYMRDIM